MATTKTVKHRSADQTRAAILAAAEATFAHRGLEGARTDAIARAAGVNKAMLFYYFSSKEKLYEAVVEESFRAFTESAVALLTKPGPAQNVLLAYVDLHFDFMAGHARSAALFQQFMHAKGKSFSRLVKRYFKPRAAALEDLLKRGMRKGVFHRGDPMQAAISVLSLVLFYFAAGQVMKEMVDFDAYAPANLAQRKREIHAFIARGLFIAPAAKRETRRNGRRLQEHT